ncbi:putative RNA methyltransferase [Lentibacillus sediminis]|uniref:putative RNA methyltransferase n=1 Tax=Lentibacillus sediminis TaxID=1940529 RepID=UPI000C1BC2DB|nr:methyltransferase domain-containing protein [Lentibacillus sediminis]
MKKQKEIAAEYMHRFESIFRCPVCSRPMQVAGKGSVVCEKRHTFDIAKQGYVNFLTSPANSKYDKALFDARRTVIQAGIYQPLHERIADWVTQEKHEHELVRMLDMGSGEGSHLARIQQTAASLFDGEIAAAGMDIAKDGVLAATKQYKEMIWCVGDLARHPFAADAFDVVLNIFSPANYVEFKKICKPDGMVVKVLPHAGYLQELRNLFYEDEEKQHYTNELTVERFMESFAKVEKQRLTYKAEVDPSFLPALLQMSPLSWHQDENTLRDIHLPEITIDVEILLGQG